MPKVRDDLDWVKILKEKDAGARASELAEKYSVHVSAIYARAKARNENGAKHAGGGRKNHAARFPNGSANGYGAVIADLEAKRDQLDRAITALRELNGE